MVYEVCALVATIILGILGIELAICLHSIRKLTNEAQQTLHDLNTYLPNILNDVRVLVNFTRELGEQVGGTVSEAAVSLEKLRKNPLRLVIMFIEGIKQVKELWQEIRQRD